MTGTKTWFYYDMLNNSCHKEGEDNNEPMVCIEQGRKMLGHVKIKFEAEQARKIKGRSDRQRLDE